VATAALNAVTVEFYNQTLDHYVMVTDPGEIASIDAGVAGPGWIRTSKSFEVEPSPGSNPTPVYRFYGSVKPGPYRGIYTVCEAERATLLGIGAATQDTSPRWNFESAGGSRAGGTTAVGACSATGSNPSYTVPIYRLYNNAFAHGGDSNHRYTGSLAVANEM